MQEDGNSSAGNYTVLLRHGSLANCPCFRIPSLVVTGPASLVLLVEARWSSSECNPWRIQTAVIIAAFRPRIVYFSMRTRCHPDA